MIIPCYKNFLFDIFLFNTHLMIALPKINIENIFAPFNWSKISSILGKGYFFFMVTLFSCLKSMHSLKVPSFFLKKSIGAPQGDTLRWIYPLFKSSLSYIYNSFNSCVLILWDVLETRETVGIKIMEKSISLFRGNHDISLKTSSNYFNIGWYSIIGTLSLTFSSIWDA